MRNDTRSVSESAIRRSPVYRKDARRAVRYVNARFPALDRHGWTHPGQPVPLNIDSVAAALAFIRQGPVVRIDSPNGLSSYALKHRMEEWGRANGLASYVGNGDAIAACLFADIPVTLADVCFGPNAATGLRLLTSDPEIRTACARLRRTRQSILGGRERKLHTSHFEPGALDE